MTPAELISKVLSGPEGEWTSTRWGDGLQILEAFSGDHDFAADAIGVLLERVDALEALCQQMRGYVADLQRRDSRPAEDLVWLCELGTGSKGEGERMSTVLAIDPGPTQSAWVLYAPRTRAVLSSHIEPNDVVLAQVCSCGQIGSRVVIEMVASMGMPVGAEVFQTVLWIGRFVEAAGGEADLITRPDVKKHLCHKCVGVNDSVIRQRLIDLFGPGKQAAIGTKKSPGPLYGIHADEWQALALAVVWSEQAAATAAEGE